MNCFDLVQSNFKCVHEKKGKLTFPGSDHLNMEISSLQTCKSRKSNPKKEGAISLHKYLQSIFPVVVLKHEAD